MFCFCFLFLSESNRNTALISLSPKEESVGSHKLTVETAEREQLGSGSGQDTLGTRPLLLGIG